MSLAQLRLVRRENHGHMREFRHLPAQSGIELNVSWDARKPLLAPGDVGDAHLVIIHDGGEMVGRKAVRLERDEVVVQPVLELEVAKDDVVQR